jgi:hypothetical protein
VALFAATLVLNLRHRDFAWFYHPDEPGKIEQVLTGAWNYHHPMLLLSATQLAMKVAGTPRQNQPVVEMGRTVSAALAALAAVALSLLAYYWRGWPAAIASGLALMLHHQLFELSHYMKEDTALLCGLALVGLLLAVFEGRTTALLAGALGAACGIAISGKYIGVISLLAALPALWHAGRVRLIARAAAFIAALFLALAVVNWPLISQPSEFRASLSRETSLVIKGQKDTTQRVPHAQYWNVFIDNTTPAIWLLLAVFLAARWRERRALTPARRQIIAFPFVFAIALSFSPKSNDRYFLPATAAFTLLAGLAVVDLARFAGRRWIAWPAAALLVIGQWPSWRKYDIAFRHDDSRELLEWVRTALPADAVIAKDSRIWLPDPKKPDTIPASAIPQKVLAAKFAADLGTLDELRARGVTHVAISESDYGRFFRASLRPQADRKEEYARRKAFYESLLRDGTLLFERDRSTVIYLHPGIRVYEIAPQR